MLTPPEVTDSLHWIVFITFLNYFEEYETLRIDKNIFSLLFKCCAVFFQLFKSRVRLKWSKAAELVLVILKVTTLRWPERLRAFTDTVILKPWTVCIVLTDFVLMLSLSVYLFEYGAQINTLRYLLLLFFHLSSFCPTAVEPRPLVIGPIKNPTLTVVCNWCGDCMFIGLFNLRGNNAAVCRSPPEANPSSLLKRRNDSIVPSVVLLFCPIKIQILAGVRCVYIHILCVCVCVNVLTFL